MIANAKVWCPDYSDEPEKCNFIGYAYDAQTVAEGYASTKHSEMDYPSQMTVCVRVGGEGDALTFDVEAVPSVEFHATPVDDPPTGHRT